MDAISILDGIKDKAKNLLKVSEPYATRDTSVYDPSLNKVIVAGITLDGVVSSTVSADVLTTQETGIDYYYTVYHQSFQQRTLTVQILPTARCLPILRVLALEQQTALGWFNISVHENGRVENVYRGWVISTPEVDNSVNAEDKSFVFGIKPMFSGSSYIDQPTQKEKETYSRYGGGDKGMSDTSVIPEDRGVNGGFEDIAISYPIPKYDSGNEDEDLGFDPNLPQDDLTN